MLHSAVTWNNLGLCFDIVGAWVIAATLVFQTRTQMYAKAATDWDWNQTVGRDLCAQQFDAAVSVLYFSVGFVLQLQLPPSATQDKNAIFVVAVIGIALLGVYFLALRGALLRWRFKHLEQVDSMLFPKQDPAREGREVNRQ